MFTYNHNTAIARGYNSRSHVKVFPAYGIGEDMLITVGYIEVPAHHPWHGLNYDTILKTHPGMEINLTYSELEGETWVIGWDEYGELEDGHVEVIQNLLGSYMHLDEITAKHRMM